MWYTLTQIHVDNPYCVKSDRNKPDVAIRIRPPPAYIIDVQLLWNVFFIQLNIETVSVTRPIFYPIACKCGNWFHSAQQVSLRLLWSRCLTHMFKWKNRCQAHTMDQLTSIHFMSRASLACDWARQGVKQFRCSLGSARSVWVGELSQSV